MKLDLADYKGKHFILKDKGYHDEDYIVVGEKTKEEALEPNFIKRHKDLCDYYGVPPYIGNDEELKRVYD